MTTRDHRPFADSPLGELIDAVASAEVSPGAGAAGAISLALAAACAGKAVAITLKRHQDATLNRAQAELARIGRQALSGADEDAVRFEDFIHHNDGHSTTQLLKAEERLQSLAGSLAGILDDLETRIDHVVAADVAAARALCRAFGVIQTRNLDETRRADTQR